MEESLPQTISKQYVLPKTKGQRKSIAKHGSLMWSSEESIGMTRKSTDGLLTASLKQTLVSNDLTKNRGPAP